MKTLNDKFRTPLEVAQLESPSGQAEAILSAIELMLNGLSEADRAAVQHRLGGQFGAKTATTSPLLGTIINLFKERPQRTVSEIKTEVATRGIETSSRTVYNAIGHLARKGHIRQIDYGRYVLADGSVLVTAEPIHCAPPRNVVDGDL